MAGHLGAMRAWARLFNAVSPQRLQRLQGTSTTDDNITLLFDFFNRYPGLRRLIGSMLLVYVARCRGYVRTDKFTDRCKSCGVPSSEHPAVEFPEHTPTAMLALFKKTSLLSRLCRAYYRSVGEINMLVTVGLLHTLEPVKQAWAYHQHLNDPKDQFEMCQLFLSNVPYDEATPRAGCLTHLIKRFRNA